MSLLQGLRLSFPAYPLCKLFSYNAGTTTKQNVYAEAALTTPLANPLSADANGLFASIFRDPSLSYKFVLAPSTDSDPPVAPIFTVDTVAELNAALLAVLVKTANYTVVTADGDDVILLVDASLGAVTVALYSAVGNAGRRVRVVKTDSSAYAVTVDPSGSQTWDGASTRVLQRQYEATNAVSDGSNWVTFANSPVVEDESLVLAQQVFS